MHNIAMTQTPPVGSQRVAVTLEFDRQRWADEYGLDPTPRAVREDFLSWLTTALASGEVPITVVPR
jgi:hypothetical protein